MRERVRKKKRNISYLIHENKENRKEKFLQKFRIRISSSSREEFSPRMNRFAI